ncbi:MAG: hypothetical protein AAF705_07950 [Bacteroidota bacterium]
MRKPIGLLLCLLVFQTMALFGQAEQFTVTYTNASSGIVYQADKGSDAVRVFPGKELPDYGRVTIKRGKWLNLIYNGQKRKLEGPLKVDLAQLATEMKVEKKSTFLGRFWNFLGNSVSQTNSANDIEKYHRRYLTNARAGISGFGDKSYPIQVPVYLTETLGASSFDLQWTALSGASGYGVTIRERDAEEIILKAYTKGNQLTIQLEELNLSSDAVYQMQITAQGLDSNQTSDNIFFSYEPAVVQEFIEDLKKDREWTTLHGVEQDLYLAQQLEEEGFFQNAHHYYQSMMKAHPQSPFFKKLYAAFLVRMDAPERAKAVLNF